MRPMSWKEVLVIVVVALTFAISCLAAAIAAEVTISIQFIDSYIPASFSALQARENELKLHHRVTMIDPELTAVNLNRRDRPRLGRVVHIAATGYPQTLLVVEEDEALELGDSNQTTTERRVRQVKPPVTEYRKLATIHPKPCSDHLTVGFDDWETLKTAVTEVNTLSIQRFVSWSRFFAEAEDFSGVFEQDALYYEEDILLNICPGATLKGRGPIFLNAPNVIISCHDCVVAVGGSHFSFGKAAKNVLIRGITFRKARASSLLFYQAGAEVTFEDCAWYDNAAISGRFGAVADVNATSHVNFDRCDIGNSQRGEAPGLASSLSVRA